VASFQYIAASTSSPCDARAVHCLNDSRKGTRRCSDWPTVGCTSSSNVIRPSTQRGLASIRPFGGRRTITGDTAQRLAHSSGRRQSFGSTCRALRTAGCGERRECRSLDRPTADSKATRGSARLASFIMRLRCGCNCGCTLLNMDNVSSICNGFSVRARLGVSC
jgi:hypothetical protein